MRSLKVTTLLVAAACLAGSADSATAGPLQFVGSTVNTGVSYMTSPFTGYVCRNGVRRPVFYRLFGRPVAQASQCTGPNCRARYRVPYQPTSPRVYGGPYYRGYHPVNRALTIPSLPRTRVSLNSLPVTPAPTGGRLPAGGSGTGAASPFYP